MPAATAPGSGATGTAAASPDSSAACFNDIWIQRPGSVVDYEHVVRGNAGSTPVRRSRVEVIGPATYQGRPAIESRVKHYAAPGESAPPRELRQYGMWTDDGFFEMTAEDADSNGPPEQVFDPPRRTKIDMRPGETFRQEHVIRSGAQGGAKQLGTAQWSWTYVGREKVKTAWGPTVETCRFDSREERRTSAITQVTESTQWLMATDPYRGFAVRTEARASYTPPGTRINQIMETLKFHEFTVR